MKNVPKHTRASSNERVFKWTYKTHLNLKNITDAISADITKHSTKESLSQSQKSSIIQLSSYKWKCDKDTQIAENQKLCSNAEKWIKYAFEKYSRQFDSERDSQIFHDLITISDESLDIDNDLTQIKNDINRTFANEPYFLSPNQGYHKVYDVLKGFTLYDKSCGYVQGMNFIIGSLAYHWDSISVFWLFTSLIEDYNLRKNYIQGFEGLYERSEIINQLLNKQNPKLSNFLVSYLLIITLDFSQRKNHLFSCY